VDLSSWLGVGFRRKLIAGVVSYMLLCWGVVFAGLVSLTSSPYSSEHFVLGGGLVCLQGFACMCLCVGLSHLVFYGRENKCVKCGNW